MTGDPPTSPSRRPRPGPKRVEGLPSGPDEVRVAVLDAAEELFADRGVENVSLRDIATVANVQMALIWRYLGKREELIEQVFVRLTDRLVAELEDHPLQSVGFERDTVMGRWTVMLAYYTLGSGRVPDHTPNPVLAVAPALAARYGLDDLTARRRAAQIAAAGLGWRMFESYLVEAAGLGDLPIAELRADLTAINRRTGAARWPTPEPPEGGGPAG